MMPVAISGTQTNVAGSSGSPSSAVPATTAPTAPMPVRIA